MIEVLLTIAVCALVIVVITSALQIYDEIEQYIPSNTLKRVYICSVVILFLAMLGIIVIK